jgi:hypothetical protein
LLSALATTLKALRADWSRPTAALSALESGRDASSGLAALLSLAPALGALDGLAALWPRRSPASGLATFSGLTVLLAALLILALGRIGETDGRQRQTDRGAGREEEAIGTHVASLLYACAEHRDGSNSWLEGPCPT